MCFSQLEPNVQKRKRKLHTYEKAKQMYNEIKAEKKRKFEVSEVLKKTLTIDHRSHH